MNRKINQKKFRTKIILFFFMGLICFSIFNSNTHTVFAANSNGQTNEVLAGIQNFFKDLTSVTVPLGNGMNIKLSAINMEASPMMWALAQVLRFINFLITFTAVFMKFSISPEYSGMLFNSDGVKAGWTLVRDFINIFFVFFLLFSAFATVFQISAYHIKKTWVMIVVMALLVNFSWPITRIIVDFTNVVMASIMGSGEVGLLAKFSDSASFFELMLGKGVVKGNTIDAVNADMMFTLLFGICIGAVILFTFATITLVLLARTMILVVLLIFAPIGFVFLAFPSTKSYANEWWSMLFKQAFIGPIIIFLLFLATTVLAEVKTTSTSLFEKAFSLNSTFMETFANTSQALLAIALFWVAILASQRLSGQATNMALSIVRKTRSLAGKATMAGLKRFDYYATGGMVGGMVERHKSKIPFTKASSEAFNKKYESAKFARSKGIDPNVMREKQKAVDKKKEYADKGMKTSDIVREAPNLRGGELEAAIETIIKNADATGEEIRDLGNVISNIEDEDLRKKLIKHAADRGASHEIVDAYANDIRNRTGVGEDEARTEARRQIVKNITFENAGKQEEIYDLIRNPANTDAAMMKTELRHKFHNARVRQKVADRMEEGRVANKFMSVIM